MREIELYVYLNMKDTVSDAVSEIPLKVLLLFLSSFIMLHIQHVVLRVFLSVNKVFE